MINLLEVSLKEFKLATKPFRDKRRSFRKALLAYEGKFLSIESEDITAVMHAEGNWTGRATFSGAVLQAISLLPPAQDPLVFSYADSHLLIGNITAECKWESVSKAIVRDLQSPSLVDLMALERTLHRSEMATTSLGRQIKLARTKVERRIAKAVQALEDLEISEAEIRMLVEERILSRLENGNNAELPSQEEEG